MKAAPHTSCPSGKRVRIVFSDGTSITTKFIERTAKFVVTEAGKFRGADIKAFSILKAMDRKDVRIDDL